MHCSLRTGVGNKMTTIPQKPPPAATKITSDYIGPKRGTVIVR